MCKQIIIGWTEETQEIVKVGRVDIGESHKFKTVLKPFACMWLNKGLDEDVVKAQAYALKEGKFVFVYEGENNPLERAKTDLLAR